MVKLKLAATAAQVKSVCDLLHQYEPMEKRQLQRIQKDGFYRGFARSILDGDKPQLGGYVFDLVHFRSINGSDLPSILPMSRKIVIKRKLKAFVGHRFNDAVTPNLRHNLAILFKAYGIQPWYSDSDSPNGPVFSIILDRIRKSDFSVFDDRETETRPNTLIEIGTAIGIGRPYFYFNYADKRTVQIGGKREKITTASDLAGMLYMPYHEYDVLLREFAVRLPLFMCDKRFARRGRV
jgi:hypothetical protein